MELAVSFRFNDGTEVRRFGYGAMRLTGQPGNFGPYGAWDEGKKVLRHALELGSISSIRPGLTDPAGTKD